MLIKSIIKARSHRLIIVFLPVLKRIGFCFIWLIIRLLLNRKWDRFKIDNVDNEPKNISYEQ